MDIDLTARQAVRTGMLVAWLAAWGLLTSAACNSSTPYGINMADGGDSNTQATIRTNDWNAGFRWARIYIRWDKVQQNAPTSTNPNYDWSDTDALVTALANDPNRQWSIIAILRGTPTWARANITRTCSDGVRPWSVPPMAYYAAIGTSPFYAFVRDAAKRYGGGIAAWELWTEPDTCSRWQGQPSDYVNLILGPGYDGIRDGNVAVNNTVQVVVAPALAGCTGGFGKWLTNSQGYLVRPIDFYSCHSYGSVASVESNLTAADPFSACCASGDPHCPLNPNGTVHCVAEYWLTEFGFGSQNGDGTPAYTGDVCSYANDASPGSAATTILKDCDGTRGNHYCSKAFYFDDDDSRYSCGSGCPYCWAVHPDQCPPSCPSNNCPWTTLPCDVGLMHTDASVRTKFCTIEQYMRTAEGLTPARVSPCQ